MIAIIDYHAGNVTSVQRALTHLGYKSCITSDSRQISDSERVIFPGVGAAGSAMQSLKELGIDALLKELFRAGKPIFGICLGTQVILSRSQEGDTTCVDLLPGEAVLFDDTLKDETGSPLKIPHMGWNQVRIERPHPIFNGLDDAAEFYFVHSYYPRPDEDSFILGTSDYGLRFASVIGYENLVATQFHPEKSGAAGLLVMKNFCEWNPS